MSKWIIGMTLAVVVILLIIISIFMPWFKVRNEVIMVGGSDPAPYWIEQEYSLQEGSAKSNARVFDTDGDGSPDNPKLKDERLDKKAYVTDADHAGAWNGDYLEGGKPEMYDVVEMCYMLIIIVILLAATTAALIPIAGVGKLTPWAPKGIGVVLILLIALIPIYYAFFLPQAINGDTKNDYRLDNEGSLEGYDSDLVPGAEAFMSSGDYSNPINLTVTEEGEWEVGPGLGWWIAVIAIFLSIGMVACISGPALPPGAPDDRPYSRDYDDPYRDEHRDRYDSSYRDEYPEPPPRRGPPRRGYDDESSRRPPPDYDRGPPDRDPYGPDPRHDRGGRKDYR